MLVNLGKVMISKEFMRLFYVSTVVLLLVQFSIYYLSVQKSNNSIGGQKHRENSSANHDVPAKLLAEKLTDDSIDLIITSKNSKTTVATTYKFLLMKYRTHLNDLSLKEKCQLYFSELYAQNPTWSNGAFKDSKYDFDVFNKNFYFVKHKEAIIKHRKAEGMGRNGETDEELLKEEDYYKIEHMYNQDLEQTLNTEQKYVDSMTNLRVFSQCYLQDPKTEEEPVNFNNLQVITNLNKKLAKKGLPQIEIDQDVVDENSVGQNKFQDLEVRVFPWLSGQLPVFLRWNGETHWGIPNIKKMMDSSYTNNKVFNRNKCFLQNFKHSVSDSGIVITGSDKQVDEIINLLKLLRGLDNELPIQIIHSGDISRENQHRLIRVAREKLSFDRKVFENVPSDMISKHFPKQELWFVNVAAAIKPRYLEFFGQFYMKFLAVLLNSFEEIILLDSDAVPLIKPADFFKLGPYKRTKTVFFQDRSSLDFLTDHDVIFFKKLLPTQTDESFFSIPRSTSKTLNNRFFSKKYRHSMESGAIAMNRYEKFASLLALIQLQIWTPANKRVWGDKELFWLSLSMIGDENYEFNKHSAVSVGSSVIEGLDDKFTQDPDKVVEYNRKVKVCSSHPGHINGDDSKTLLWFNSGFKNCKRNSWKKDSEEDAEIRAQFEGNSTKVREFYNSHLHITSALLPGENVYKRLPADAASHVPDIYRNFYGWDMTTACDSYTYCATEVMNSKSELKNPDALLVEFDEKQVSLYDYLGRLWNSDTEDEGEHSIVVGE